MKLKGIAAVVCALTMASGSAGAAHAAPTAAQAKVLYSQNADSLGRGLMSTAFTDGYHGWTSAGADDFTVPAGQTWSIRDVDVTGTYAAGGGTDPESVNVFFYADGGGMPGSLLASYQVAVTPKAGPSFHLALGSAETLTAGTYWLSVQAVGVHADHNHRFWIWESTADTPGAIASWENPQDGFHTGCTTWTEVTRCGSQSGLDFMFALRGKAS